MGERIAFATVSRSVGPAMRAKNDRPRLVTEKRMARFRDVRLIVLAKEMEERAGVDCAN